MPFKVTEFFENVFSYRAAKYRNINCQLSGGNVAENDKIIGCGAKT